MQRIHSSTCCICCLVFLLHSACCYLNFMIICTVVAAVGRDYKLQAGRQAALLALWYCGSLAAWQVTPSNVPKGQHWPCSFCDSSSARRFARIIIRCILSAGSDHRTFALATPLLGAAATAARSGLGAPSCLAIQMTSAPCPTCPIRSHCCCRCCTCSAS